MAPRGIAFILSDLARSPKTWLVTGVAGFIGSHIFEILMNLEQRVVGLDNFSTGKRQNLTGVLAGVHPQQRKRFKMIEGSVNHYETCFRACECVDYVLHQAFVPPNELSVDDTLRSHNVNVNGFLNMLVAAQKQHVRRFVYASCGSVYGDSPILPRVEGSLGNPSSFNGVTKRISELYANIFSSRYGMETIGLRYFNVFGGRQDHEGPAAAVIPRWIHAMAHNKPALIHGDGSTTRAFCYVANIVQANLLSAVTSNRDALGAVFNIASPEPTTLKAAFANIRQKLLPRFPHLAKYNPVHIDFRSGEVQHLLADISKARNLLGYEPTHNFEQGLDATLKYYINTGPTTSN